MSASPENKGFTLVGLLVCLVILAILGAIAYAYYGPVRKNALNSKRISDIKSIAAAYEVKYDGAYHPLTDEDFSERQIPLEAGDKTYTGFLSADACAYKICTPLIGHPQQTCDTSSPTCFCLTAQQADPKTCPVIPAPTSTPAAVPTPTPSPAIVSKRVFITNTWYPPTLGGVSGANNRCQQSANTARLGGTWKAWISTNNINARDNLAHNNGPYVQLDQARTKIADNWNDLTDGTLDNPIRYTENKTAESGVGVFTNTNPRGQKVASNTDCNGFTSFSSQLFFYHGEGANPTNNRWTQDKITACDHNKKLYCFEQ